MAEDKLKDDSKTSSRLRKANKVLNIMIVLGVILLVIMVIGLRGLFLWY